MMDEAKEASKSAEKFVVAKHRFECATKTEGCMCCFFEGLHDKDYYKTHIRTICGEIIEIPCHCKANVLKMYREIHSTNKDKYRLAYFIDRDFDELLNNPDFFETEGYSIENYYCSADAFSRILTDYLYVDHNSDDYRRAMDFYDEQFRMAHSIVAEFNHYYSAVKRREKNCNEKYSIELEDSFPKELGSIGVNNYRKDYDLERLNMLYGTSITQSDLDAEKGRLDVCPCLMYRGKYEIQQLESILEYLIKEAAGERNVHKENRVLRKRPKMNCIQPGQLLLVLSAMADFTQGLRNYLNKFRIE